LVTFAGDAAVERAPGSRWSEVELDASLALGATDISAAIYEALQIMPSSGVRRIVLLTDGAETRGSADTAARAAAAAGVEIDVVPLTGAGEYGEVLVQSITAPDAVAGGESHEIRSVIGSTTDTQAEVILLRDGDLVGRRSVPLSAGDTVVSFQTAVEEDGWYKYQVFVRGGVDRLPQNNTATTHVQVRGRPVVLYVSQPEEQSEPFLRAIATQGILVRTTTPNALPATLPGLLENDAVIVDNVPAYDLSVRKMEVLEDYVEGAGGGFLMVGGDVAYGAGGYFRTPVERLLPVDMDITSSMRIPSLAMVFVIDKSGSMGNTEVGGASKLDLVKEAVLSSVEIMNPFYNVGLLAFDADFEWTVPLTPAGEQERIVELLASLESGGGTILDAALEEAHRVLRDTRASVKHLVVLSDGLASEAEFEPIIRRLLGANITVSTVSIGANANRTLMEDMARWGDGRHYHTSSTRNIPRIFTSETTIVSRNLVVEETFFPTITGGSPILSGFDTEDFPPLRGFVLTYPKAGANQPMSGTGDNPILATWRYGLGRTAAFTSDFRGKWGRDWVGWDGFPRFAAQLVRWIERPSGNERIDVTFDRGDRFVTVDIEARTVSGEYLSGRRLAVRVLDPSGEISDYTTDHVAPGAYRARIPTESEGDYFVTVRDLTEGPETTAPHTAVLNVPYSREYTRSSADFALLESIADRTGGVVAQSDPSAVYRPGESSGGGLKQIWPYLSLAALGLFLIELLFVYVLLPSGFAARLARLVRSAKPTATGHSYDEVRDQILEGYRAERERKKDLRTWFRLPRGVTKSDRKVFKR
jgi:Mg-chelatase subunit ChlD